MSAGDVGGTKFRLGLDIPEFQRQFNLAKNAAQAGSNEIARALDSIAISANRAAQTASTSLTRALSREGVSSGLDEVKVAADGVKASLESLDSGDVVSGFSQLTKAADSLDAAITKINKTTTTLRQQFGRGLDDEVRAGLSRYSAQAATLQTAFNAITSATAGGNRTLGGLSSSQSAAEEQANAKAISQIKAGDIAQEREARKQLQAEEKAYEDALAAEKRRELAFEASEKRRIKQEEQQYNAAMRAMKAGDLALERSEKRRINEEERLYNAALAANKSRELSEERAEKRRIAEEERLYNKALGDMRRAELALEREEKRRQAEEEKANRGGIGQTLLTGIGLGSGAAIAQTAITQITRLLGTLKEGAIDFNDQLDQSNIAWTVLAGNAENAAKQVNMLFEFSKQTPFLFEEVDKAARLLAAFGGAAFATAENLKLLGNVAAGTKQPLNTIAYEFGQIYTEIENGLPFGRAARALVTFGALTAESRVRMEEMQAAGVDTGKILELLYNDLGRFGNQLEAQSKTLSGGLSTAKDSLNSLVAVAARPAFEQLKNALLGINTFLNDPNTEEGAKNIAIALMAIGDALTIIDSSLVAVQRTWIASFLAMEYAASKAFTQLLRALDFTQPGRFTEQLRSQEKATKAIYDEMVKNAENFNKDLDTVDQAQKDLKNRRWADAGTDNSKAYTDNFKAEYDKAVAELADQMEIASRLAGLQASRAFTEGFTKENYEQLADLQDVVANAIFGSKASGKLKGDAEKLIGEISPILAKAIDEIRQSGQVSTGISIGGDVLGTTDDVAKLTNTMKELKDALPPDAFQAVQAYLQSVERLTDAQVYLDFATVHLANEQQHLTDVQNQAKDATDKASAAYENAQRVAENNARAQQSVIDGIQDDLKNLQDEAKNAAQGWTDQLAELNDELDNLKTTADNNQKAFEDMVEPLKKEGERLSTVAKQNAEIYKAVLDGTTQEYLDQNNILDEQTRKIAEKWEAEIGGKRRAAEGANAKVAGIEVRERAEVLALEEKIRVARLNHNEAQARGLEREQERLKQRYAYQLDLERQRAGVANDALDASGKKLQTEAEKQAAVDQKKIDANKAEIDSLTEQAKLQKEMDDAAIKAKSDEIKSVEDLQEADKRRHDAIIADKQTELDAAERHKKLIEDEDRDHVQGAKDHLAEVKKFWDGEIDAAKDRVTAAERVRDLAKEEASAAKDTTDAIKDRLKYIQQENDLYLQKINAWRANEGLPALTWDQIIKAGGSGGLSGDVGVGGVGEGRGPQQPYQGPDPGSSVTPIIPAQSPRIQPKVPEIGPQAFISPSEMVALSVPGSSGGVSFIRSNTNNNKGNVIQKLSFFEGANISKEIDVDAAADRAAQQFIRAINGEVASGGSITVGISA